MKAIVVLVVLSVLAFLADFELASLGLLLAAVVLLFGAVVQSLPESSCTHNCRQSRDCTCRPAAQRNSTSKKEST